MRDWNVLELFQDGDGVVHVMTSWRDLDPDAPGGSGDLLVVSHVRRAHLMGEAAARFLEELSSVVQSTDMKGE